MAVKRRVVWFSDEEWAALKAYAALQHNTVTGVLRDMWNLAAEAAPASRTETIAINKLSQVERDAILRRVNRTGRDK